MPTYVFKGRNRLGEVMVGERVADSHEMLKQLLRREQVMLTSVRSALCRCDIPAAPVIAFPQEGGVVSPNGFTVMWNHVTTTLDGRPLNRTGYEIILTKDVPDDPNGFSRPALSIHVPPSETSLTIPSEFLEPGSRYEIEVIVLEVSGNQTITSLFFETQ